MAAAECIWSNWKYDFQATLTYSSLLYGHFTSDLRATLTNMLFISHIINKIPNLIAIYNHFFNIKILFF